jgi:hypothetical protein
VVYVLVDIVLKVRTVTDPDSCRKKNFFCRYRNSIPYWAKFCLGSVPRVILGKMGPDLNCRCVLGFGVTCWWRWCEARRVEAHRWLGWSVQAGDSVQGAACIGIL